MVDQTNPSRTETAMSDTQTTVTYTVQNAGLTTESWLTSYREIMVGYFAKAQPAEFDTLEAAEDYVNEQLTHSTMARFRIVQTVTTVIMTSAPRQSI